MVKDCRKLLRNALVEQVSRHDVENHQLGEDFRMIQSEAMRRAAAAIMPREREFFESQVLHYFHLVLCHRPLRVGEMISASGRLTVVSVTAQVRHPKEIILRQRWGDFAP